MSLTDVFSNHPTLDVDSSGDTAMLFQSDESTGPWAVRLIAESKKKKTTIMAQKIFIDTFSVPVNASKEFIERMTYNRNFLKKLPGFIEDNAYEATGNNGNLLIVTIAVWESEEAIAMAKEAVQAEYKKIGFNMTEFLQRNNISIERGVYSKMSE